ncbi:MAG: hypothetical protein JNM55_13105 [Anaerolineales bacterium]|nr:hypothetical protein [Anaerolineales bacterium]
MKPLKLTRPKKDALRKASREKIEGYFASLPTRYRSEKWIHKSNTYRYLCTSRYEDDIDPGTTSTVNHNDLVAYIGASAPTHISDGWSYLGRAVDAMLRGDAYVATHLGYYAELRAGMGLLASEGIGVLRNKHPVVDSHNITRPLAGKGTHADIWPIINHWTTLQRATDLLDDLIRPSSIKLSDWLSITGTATPVRAVAQQWLRSWGVDLAVAEDDHDCRNLASYRPSEFRRPPKLDVHQQTSFAEELWQLFEPSTTRRFPNLENFLLRNAFRNQAGGLPSAEDIQNLGLTTLDSSSWATFLQQTNDPSPIRLAEHWAPVDDPTCHLRIISRAALLLFVASSAARRLLSNAGYTSNDVRFWWARHGDDRGLWNTGSIPNDPQDLWADIAQAISDSAQWRGGNSMTTASLRDWRTNQSSALADFGGFELAGIWALMP